MERKNGGAYMLPCGRLQGTKSPRFRKERKRHFVTYERRHFGHLVLGDTASLFEVSHPISAF